MVTIFFNCWLSTQNKARASIAECQQHSDAGKTTIAIFKYVPELVIHMYFDEIGYCCFNLLCQSDANYASNLGEE